MRGCPKPKEPEYARGGCVGILAGAGPLPAQVAAAALEKGKSVFVVGFRDFADTALLAPYPHEIIRLAAVGETLAALKSMVAANWF